MALETPTAAATLVLDPTVAADAGVAGKARLDLPTERSRIGMYDLIPTHPETGERLLVKLPRFSLSRYSTLGPFGDFGASKRAESKWKKTAVTQARRRGIVEFDSGKSMLDEHRAFVGILEGIRGAAIRALATRPAVVFNRIDVPFDAPAKADPAARAELEKRVEAVARPLGWTPKGQVEEGAEEFANLCDFSASETDREVNSRFEFFYPSFEYVGELYKNVKVDSPEFPEELKLGNHGTYTVEELASIARERCKMEYKPVPYYDAQGNELDVGDLVARMGSDDASAELRGMRFEAIVRPVVKVRAGKSKVGKDGDPDEVASVRIELTLVRLVRLEDASDAAGGEAGREAKRARRS